MHSKRTPLFLVFLAIFLFLALPALAGNDSATVTADAEAPLELAHASPPQPSMLTELQKERARLHADFTHFAEVWVAKLNRNHRLSKSRMKVQSSVEGGYVARYNLMDGKTIVCQIRPTSSKTIPYLGILKYKERRFERTSDSADDCKLGEFHQKSIVAHTEIFNYKNGRWQ